MQNLSCEMIFYYYVNKTHFHKKGFALGLVLRVRVLELGNGLFNTYILEDCHIQSVINSLHR